MLIFKEFLEYLEKEEIFKNFVYKLVKNFSE